MRGKVTIALTVAILMAIALLVTQEYASLAAASPPHQASTTCSSCDDCSEKLYSGLYERVTLTADISEYHGTCIELRSDTVFDCDGHKIDGDDSLSPDPWVDNIPFSGVSMFWHSTDNTVQNCTISDFEIGVYIFKYSTNNTITNNHLISNHYYGIGIQGSSDSNNISFNTANDNMEGIRISENSNHNNINNNTAKDNDIGITVFDSHNNAVNSNVFCNNADDDFYIDGGSGNSGDENVCDKPDGWNDVGTTGCTDPCTGTIRCDSCSDCNRKLDGTFDTVILEADISDHHGSCIDFGAYDVVFDCDGHKIDGDDAEYDIGIDFWGGGNTVRNCDVTDFAIGIRLTTSQSGNALYNNTANSNTNTGIWLWHSRGDILSNNTANSNTRSGFVLKDSSGITLTNNTASWNSKNGIYLAGSDDNQLQYNVADSNGDLGIFLGVSLRNALL
ncbi:MAG: NosD domain-containing protein, partial [Planctomycetota bacterium]